MNYCQKIQELSHSILNAETDKKRIEIKNQFISLCDNMPDVDESFKSVKKETLKSDLNIYISNPKLNEHIIETLRISMKKQFDCSDVKTIDR